MGQLGRRGRKYAGRSGSQRVGHHDVGAQKYGYRTRIDQRRTREERGVFRQQQIPRQRGNPIIRQQSLRHVTQVKRIMALHVHRLHRKSFPLRPRPSHLPTHAFLPLRNIHRSRFMQHHLKKQHIPHKMVQPLSDKIRRRSGSGGGRSGSAGAGGGD